MIMKIPAQEEKPEPEKGIIVLEDPPPSSAQVSREQALWMAITAGVVSLVFALIIVFSVLSALNDGLRYASPASVNELQIQIELLQSQADALDTDVEDLRSRVNNLDSLSGRVTALEDTVGTMEGDVENLAADVETINEQTDAIAADVENLESASSKYQDFINALQELLSGFAESENNND